MAQRVERLKRRADFLRVTRARNSAATPGLVLQARPRRPGEGEGGRDDDAASPARIRVGFTASRKVGNAVARNRAKRRLRALADALLPRHAAAGTDYVVIARAATPQRPFDSLRRDFVGALKRLGHYRPDDARPADARTEKARTDGDHNRGAGAAPDAGSAPGASGRTGGRSARAQRAKGG